MLELYHWEPTAASGRVLICLAEKGLAFERHYVDLLQFEQHLPDFLRLNPSGEVPVLVDDGRPMTEASYIAEYLDEAYPAIALMPSDPAGRWAVRAWQKYVDDVVAPAIGELAWASQGLPHLAGRDPDQLAAAVARIPARERRDVWTAAIAGFAPDRLAASRGRVIDALKKTEADLGRGEWLAGAAYSLADIAAYPYLGFVPRVMPEALDGAPLTAAWLARMAARPAVGAALGLCRAADPFAIAAPGPEPVRWG